MELSKQHHKVFRIIFPNLCVLCVSVVKTADFKLNIGFGFKALGDGVVDP